jgi:cytochrome c
MQRRQFLGIAAGILGGVRLAAAADTHGTPEEAKTMVEKAAALITSDGQEKAFVVIDNPTGPFVDGDLYVFVTSFEGVTLAHGLNKALIGKNLLHVKDADGKLFVQAMIDVAKDKGEGWVDYKWPNPTSKKIEDKSSFIKRVGDTIVGCGIYKG